MKLTCQSEFGKIKTLFIKRVGDAFVSDVLIAKEWKALNFLGKPDLQKAKEELQRLETEWQRRRAEIYAQWKATVQKYAEVLLKPRKADVDVSHFGLAWAPVWRTTLPDGKMESVTGYALEKT